MNLSASSPSGASLATTTVGMVAAVKHFLSADKRGRQLSDVWGFFTDDPNAHKHVSAVFRATMTKLEFEEHPDWFEGVKRSKLEVKVCKQGSTPTMRQTSEKEFLMPAMISVDVEAIFMDVAMHYYVTGSAFQRAKESHLARAFRRAHPNAKIPNRR
ncbi:hypothetical protein H257_18164 [Aphanomyces astaci]|uniref:Uncharacterized protein n=1 Tax=Aphanomyces astaci TaxID=112090 RepID=W4FC47_APHAT|nr:hypothetical protein H257_18164 [Aphanomyces astaci]ETV65040.1 hypothetical protein H257_18164 [Aphanomyces astaci]|eukprot:XP_009845476.1 hypothetical protein H257_18164 [Aphanomyces astaci]